MEKSSDRLKREYGHDQYVAIYGDKAWNAANGVVIEGRAKPDEDLIVPESLPVRYDGPVYLLISTRTFSSAMSCALAAKDYGLATIVGEETGEPVNSTGEVYTLTTPSIGLRAYLTTKVFFPPKPQPIGQGVLPDVSISATPEDRAAERNPALDYVFSHLSKSAR